MAKTKTPKSKLDISSLLGIALALGGILGGLILEGGKISDVSQLTAALIVLGGTLGAVMLTSPADSLKGAAGKLGSVFFETAYSPRETIDEIMSYAAKARRNGIVSLEQEIDGIPDKFLRKALSLVVDGTDVQEIRKMMELELEAQERSGRGEAKVYEAAGGYAPTVGIIGAVLGLIQVMKNISDVEMVGHGIAVAFVATVYGVAAANLFFLPAGAKLKARLEKDVYMKELMLEGVCSIVQGLHPKVIERKLEAYAWEESKPEGKSRSRASMAEGRLAAEN